MKYSYPFIQVYTKYGEGDAYAWVPAKIKMLKGEFAVVDFLVGDANDIVPLDKVRPLNNK